MTSPPHPRIASTVGQPHPNTTSPSTRPLGLSPVGDSFNLPTADLENNDIAQIPSPNRELAENQPTTPGVNLYSGSPSPFTPFPHHKTAGRRRR
ncbi:hypothetical protein BDN70DRAFT_886766 [Pholiota conissans]|uniref:Uncharacterized protein n=1 Tax=Pholiota conissans TaxID=109636 RepID=A0A9P6CUK2_9AGAR|nr:hypothetical protein BDN70DRAFT_886766 [Pholiota conissans]